MASELILGPRSGAGSAASPRPRRLPSTAGAVLLLLLAGAVAPAPAGAGDDWIPDNYPVRFLMLGDWGRATEADPGGFNQSMVADRMAQLAAERQFFLSAGPSFVLSTGDNFYKIGLKDVDDPLFDIKFSDIYYHESLQIPWFCVLGNHDYGDSSNCEADQITTPLAQLDAGIRDRDWRFTAYRNYRMSVAGGRIDFFFWDTNPSQDRYNYGCFASFDGGLHTQDWIRNQAWLRGALNRSTAEWKIIVGHHPPHSSGSYAPGVIEVQEAVQHLIQRYGVQAYFSGHDHILEYLHYRTKKSWQANYHLIISGGGSARGHKGFGQPAHRPISPFSIWGRKTEGFNMIKIDKNEMRVEIFHLDYQDGGLPAFTAYIPRIIGGPTSQPSGGPGESSGPGKSSGNP